MTRTSRCVELEHTHTHVEWMQREILKNMFSFSPLPPTQHQNQLILGVMGIDVSLDDIKKLTPRFTVSSMSTGRHKRAVLRTHTQMMGFDVFFYMLWLLPAILSLSGTFGRHTHY